MERGNVFGRRVARVSKRRRRSSLVFFREPSRRRGDTAVQLGAHRIREVVQQRVAAEAREDGDAGGAREGGDGGEKVM